MAAEFFQKQTSEWANFAEIFRALNLGYIDAGNTLLSGHKCDYREEQNTC